MKKKDKQALEEVTTDLTPDVEERAKKKISKLKLLSILWTVFMFGVYIALDAYKIVKDGWTPVNIIVTAFLGLQIILFIVFTAIGARDKKQAKQQKSAVKYVKKAKKITLKLTTLVTSILLIIGVEKVSFVDVMTIVVALISLAIMLISLILSIRKQVKKAKVERRKESKMQ